MMSECILQRKASVPSLEHSFRIVVSRQRSPRSAPPFVHPKVTWIPCALDSECLAKAADERPDLVLLEPNGFDQAALLLCRSLRSDAKTNATKIAIWSPDLELSRRLEFYEAGADDVVTDVVIGSESVMRLTAEARRSLSDKDQISFGDLILFPDRHMARRRGKSVLLSSFQLRLLRFLVANPDTLLSREELAAGLWDDHSVQACSISTAMNRLRHLLNVPGAPDLIHTVRGFGYILQAK